jgi:hypothetical protein
MVRGQALVRGQGREARVFCPAVRCRRARPAGRRQRDHARLSGTAC